MKSADIFYYVRVSVLLALLAVTVLAVRPAQAQQASLEKVLEGKLVIGQGLCPMETPERLTTDPAKAANLAQCVVGRGPEDTHHNFVGLQDEQGYYLVIRVDTNTKEQEVVWRRGTSI